MSILIYVEGADGELKKSSKEAIAYAAETGKITGDTDIIAVAIGQYQSDSLAELGAYGAGKVIHIALDDDAAQQIAASADALAYLMQSQQANTLIMTKSAFCDNVGGRVAGITGASIVSSVVALPEVSNGFTVKRAFLPVRHMQR